MKSLALFLLSMVLFSGCIHFNQAETVVQENAQRIAEDLNSYNLTMNSNQLSIDGNFWEVTVYDKYAGDPYGSKPQTYCVVRAAVNKTTKEIDHLFFGLLCPRFPVNGSKPCTNFRCIGVNGIDMVEDWNQLKH
jgi:hypothetical protein